MKMKTIADNFVYAAQPVTDQDLVFRILTGVGSEHDSSEVSVNTWAEPLTINYVHGLLLTHENRFEQAHSIEKSLLSNKWFYQQNSRYTCNYSQPLS